MPPRDSDPRVALRTLTARARRLQRKGQSARSILHQLLHASPWPALVANDDGVYVFANSAASKLSGYSTAELRGLSVWQLTPESRTHEAEVLWRAFIQQGEQVGEYALSGKDGPIKVRYAAAANVLPGLHLSVFQIAPASPVTAGGDDKPGAGR